MKMVLVFDTDDSDGMRTSMKMMKTILREYATQWDEQDPKFGKIEFIKMLRDLHAYHEIQGDRGHDITSLRHLKRFMEEVWSQKKDGGYYKRQWKNSEE
tara:strand:- start:22 stop:318 length:297 start_codon:yes stop_codon:yes gene_type:complete